MSQNKKYIATIEARMTSSRLPGKVLMEACGKPLLQHLIEREKRCTEVDDVVVATTINKEDDPIVELCEHIGCSYYRGSENDVLGRVLNTAKEFEADVIVETTGDNPCIDWRQMDYLIRFYRNNNYDFVTNMMEQSFAEGFEFRIFSTEMLEYVNDISDDPLDREHVAIYFPKHPETFKCYNWRARGREYRPDLQVTLDEMGDYLLIKNVFEALYPLNNDFQYMDVVGYLSKHKDVRAYIDGIKRTVI